MIFNYQTVDLKCLQNRPIIFNVKLGLASSVNDRVVTIKIYFTLFN